jgi:putative nucleotidyltransferase with HDIG domain
MGPSLNRKVTLSLGLSLFPEPAATKDELISQADLALFHAKNLGKDNIRFYQNVIEHIRREISPDQQQLIGAFRTLLSTVAVKDKYTLGHSERVASYAEAIGEAMGLDPKKISILRYAGILHDIGKIEIPGSILNKTNPLTEEEFRLIRQHPVYGENILEPLEDMGDLREIVRHHHERYDGKGYPDGLSGRSISIEARILCVVDSFDAMLSDRPYAKRKTLEEACNELNRCAGSQFDPQIVEIFINEIRHRKGLCSPQNQKILSF